jgi:hypothetical protein
MANKKVTNDKLETNFYKNLDNLTDSQNLLISESMNYLNANSNNTFNGQIVTINVDNKDITGYVTDKGIFKKLPDPEQNSYDNSIGNFILKDNGYYSTDVTPHVLLFTKGEDMIMNNSIGYEGSNIYANHIPENDTFNTSKSKCYQLPTGKAKDLSTAKMKYQTDFNNGATYAQCKQRTIDLDNSYFGLSKGSEKNNGFFTGECWISKNRPILEDISEDDKGTAKDCSNNYGGTDSISFYKLDLDGRRSYAGNFGKLAHLTDDGMRKNYDKMVVPGNTYTFIDNFMMDKNKHINAPISGTNAISNCEIACNKNSNCGGFYYDGESCFLKSRADMFPTALRQLVIDNDSNTYQGIYIRDPSINKLNPSCESTIHDVRTNQFHFYPKNTSSNGGSNMTPQTLCNLAGLVKTEKSQIKKDNKQLNTTTTKLINEMKHLSKMENKFLKEKLQSENLFDNLLKEYNHMYKQIINFIGDGNKNDGTLGGMVEDSDYKLVTSNYRYVLWSILAIIVIIGSIKISRKNK